MVERILFVLVCLAIPILWGLAVNWAYQRFDRLRSKQPSHDGKEPPFPDYQI